MTFQNPGDLSTSKEDPFMCSYVRLELLEGVAAYYSGDKGLACARLKASQARWQQLQVSDERLVELLSMGFEAQEVTLHIRITKLRRQKP